MTDKIVKTVTTDKNTFTIVLTPEEVGGYSAVCPALKGCISQGETIEEALENITDAIELYIETVKLL